MEPALLVEEMEVLDRYPIGAPPLNIGLSHAATLLNPPSGEPWRKIAEQETYLTERDRSHFHIENQPFGVRILADTRTERGKEIAATFLIPVYQPFLAKWITEQTAYIGSLPPRPAFVLRAYSRHGDVLVNRYLRKQRTDMSDIIDASIRAGSIPFMYQIYDNYDILRKRYRVSMPPKKDLKTMELARYVDILIENRDIFKSDDVLLLLMKGFFEDLMRIFLKAPRLPHSVLTYRGIVSESHLKSLRYRTSDFQSTSINPYSANTFTQQIDYKTENGALRRRTPKESLRYYGPMRCCMYEIRVEPSVPCLYLEAGSYFQGEYELLLPPGIDMELGDIIEVRTIVTPPRRAKSDILNYNRNYNNYYNGNNDLNDNNNHTNITVYPEPDPGIIELVKNTDNVFIGNNIGENVDLAVFRPPTRFGAPLTPDEKEKLFDAFLENYYSSFHSRIAIVPARATSVYFSAKKKAPLPVLNDRVSKSHRRAKKTEKRIQKERHKARHTRRRSRLARPSILSVASNNEKTPLSVSPVGSSYPYSENSGNSSRR